ncbi:MAG TPA: ABC transporter permease [Trueperaceae bacterium]|nr:ABC transporter permease [Trueperaceae bacterium]
MRRFLKIQAPALLFRAVVVLIYAFMFLPIAIVVLVSLNAEPYLTLPPESFSLRWYRQVFTPTWLPPLRYSLVIAAAAALGSGLLGGLGAFAIARYKFPGRAALQAFLMSPLSIPSIVTGVAILQFATMVNLQGMLGTPALIVGHIVVTLPFTVRMIGISLFNFDRSVEQAAANLGARPGQVLRHVTLPLMKPGIFAGMTFAFIVSFNNVPVSLFLVRPGATTLPIEILNFLQYRLDPTLAAVNMVSLVIVLALVAIAERAGGFTKFVYGRS